LCKWGKRGAVIDHTEGGTIAERCCRTMVRERPLMRKKERGRILRNLRGGGRGRKKATIRLEGA